MLSENVVKLLKSGMWDLATCANGEPNVVPVAFKDVTPDGKLVVGDVFLDTTLKNLAASNGKIAISVYDAQNLEGYQVKGTAQYVTEGEVASTASVMFPIFLRNSLYRSVPSVASTQIMREFHFPPNISMPYSSGQRMSFSSFLWYMATPPAFSSL